MAGMAPSDQVRGVWYSMTRNGGLSDHLTTAVLPSDRWNSALFFTSVGSHPWARRNRSALTSSGDMSPNGLSTTMSSPRGLPGHGHGVERHHLVQLVHRGVLPGHGPEADQEVQGVLAPRVPELVVHLEHPGPRHDLLRPGPAERQTGPPSPAQQPAGLPPAPPSLAA